ncbi:MAG: penicillin-binding protein 1A [Inhella sp.]
MKEGPRLSLLRLPPLLARNRRLLLGSLVALPLALLIVASMVAAVLWQQLPALDRLTDYQPKEPLRIFSADGVLIGEFGSERRRFVPLSEIPKPLQDALLAVEDTDFWNHPGLDVSGIVRALWRNLTHRGPRHGASTITQQLARDTYLSKEQTWSRKAVEALLALKMERELSKAQILEIYMNQIFMGNRAYGFAAASERYFGKRLEQLSTAEIALLVGLPKDPVRLNPVTHLERAKRRQAVVLERLAAVGLISPGEVDVAKATPLLIKRPKRMSSIADHAAEMVRAEVVARYGEDAYARGLQVTTTLLSEEQVAAQQGLRRALFDLERRQAYRGAEGQFPIGPADAEPDEEAVDAAFNKHPDLGELRAALVLQLDKSQAELLLSDGQRVRLAAAAMRPLLVTPKEPSRRVQRGSVVRLLPVGKDWAISQAPEAEGAVVSLDPSTGAIRALVGGFDFARGQFNHVTQAYRQPGSSFKPFVYSAAIEIGAWEGTEVSDEPVTYGDWSPKNYDGTYEPSLTLRQALARSKNMVTIRLLDHLGVARVRSWAAQFGLEEARQPQNLTLALGSGAVTPLQMAQAYSAFAAGGKVPAVHLIDKVSDAQGQVLWQATPTEPKQAISERNAFMTAQLLAAVTREGTGARASALLNRWDLYGKTGTTNDAMDAWFVGFQATRTAAVWIGYPTPRSLGERETGGGLALPVWVSTMAAALKGVPVSPLSPPAEGLVQQGEAWFYEELAGDLALKRIGPEPSAEPASAPENAGASAPP